MSKSKLKILLSDLQNTLNLINTHFLFWSYNEFESPSDFFQNSPKISPPIPHTHSADHSVVTEVHKESSLTQKVEKKIEIVSSKDRSSKKSSWELVSMPLGDSTISLPTHTFSSLTKKLIPFPKIVCAILIKTNNNEDTLFLERLAKIITKFLFPCQIIHLHKKEDFVTQTKRFSLTLVPIKELTANGIKTKVHQQVTLNNNIIIPLDDIDHYMSNSPLKQDLWKQLNQIYAHNMQK